MVIRADPMNIVKFVSNDPPNIFQVCFSHLDLFRVSLQAVIE